MRFAKIVFNVAGIWGLLILTPFYFLEGRIGRQHPPAITHPEYFYGFVGVAIAFQLVFVTIGRDPVRYRPCMVPSIIEKFSFVIACVFLVLSGRMESASAVVIVPDLLLGILFVVAYLKTAATALSRAAAV